MASLHGHLFCHVGLCTAEPVHSKRAWPALWGFTFCVRGSGPKSGPFFLGAKSSRPISMLKKAQHMDRLLLPQATAIWCTSRLGPNLANLSYYYQQPQSGPPRALVSNWQCCFATASNHQVAHLSLTPCSQFSNIGLLPPASTTWSSSQIGPNLACLLYCYQQPEIGPPRALVSTWPFCFATANSRKITHLSLTPCSQFGNIATTSNH